MSSERMSERVNFRFPLRQVQNLRDLSERAEVPVSDLIRRMIDHCCRSRVIGDVVPMVSGFVGFVERS